MNNYANRCIEVVSLMLVLYYSSCPPLGLRSKFAHGSSSSHRREKHSRRHAGTHHHDSEPFASQDLRYHSYHSHSSVNNPRRPPAHGVAPYQIPPPPPAAPRPFPKHSHLPSVQPQFYGDFPLDFPADTTHHQSGGPAEPLNRKYYCSGSKSKY